MQNGGRHGRAPWLDLVGARRAEGGATDTETGSKVRRRGFGKAQGAWSDLGRRSWGGSDELGEMGRREVRAQPWRWAETSAMREVEKTT
jgi:hypothetical protein